MNGRVSSFPCKFSGSIFPAAFPVEGPVAFGALFFRPISFTRKLFTHVSRVGKFSPYSEIRVAVFPPRYENMKILWSTRICANILFVCSTCLNFRVCARFFFFLFILFIHLFILNFGALLLYELGTFRMSRVWFVRKICRFAYCLSNIQSLIPHMGSSCFFKTLIHCIYWF